MAGIRNMESMEGKGTGGVDWSGRDVLDLINAQPIRLQASLEMKTQA